MTIQQQFSGTWKLISQHTHHPDGTITPSRGENPVGVIMYDANGNMAVQLMRVDDHAAEYTDLTTFSTAMSGYLAYFGTYKIDEASQTVTHHVIGASYFGYRGTQQIRRYTFDGDRLTLEAESNDTHRVLVWQKA
jgi:hypothetical protein